MAREAGLAYDEPWAWMQPVSHALGALLLARDRHAEAEAVFRDDLKQYPDNVWALAGLVKVSHSVFGFVCLLCCERQWKGVVLKCAFWHVGAGVT